MALAQNRDPSFFACQPSFPKCPSAAALFRLGKVAEAEQAFRATLVKNPQDALSLAGLGAVQLSQNQPAEALKLYEQQRAHGDNDIIRTVRGTGYALDVDNDAD